MNTSGDTPESHTHKAQLPGNRDEAGTGHRVTLSRRDIIVFEQRLKDAVAALFPFKGHSIHFPRSAEALEPVWSAEEKKLLLPLPAPQTLQTLGVFVARGVNARSTPALMPHWPALGALITDNLLLYKRSLCDPVTGLFSRHYLLECMKREIETLRDPLPVAGGRPSLPAAQADSRPAARSVAAGRTPLPSLGGRAEVAASSPREGLFADGADLPRRVCIGTLVVRLAALRDVVREFGYQFADELMVALADALTALCPEQALAARTGDSEFAVHLPAASPKACRKLAGDIAAALRSVFVVHPLRRERVGITASVGFTLYPQDMTGDLFVRPAAEQARLVLRKARLASALADEERPMLSAHPGAEPVMGFGRILAEGGRVLETLPLSRVVVSLGAGMHAREGQRFSVWSVHYPVQGAPQGAGLRTAQGGGRTAPSGGHTVPLYKGELVLMEVEENASQAEIIHLGDPAWNIEPGDRLVLLPEEQAGIAPGREGEERRDPATGLLRHGDFFARWAEARETCDGFALALVRLAPGSSRREDGMETTEETAASGASGMAGPSGPVGTASATAVGAQGGPETPGAPTGSDDLFDGMDSFDSMGDPEGEGAAYPGRIVAEAAQLCREELGLKTLGGRYGLNSLIFFHPHLDAEKATALYENLARTLKSRLGIEAAVGIACHPYLDFRKADTLENCRKALEYAMLLPRPHVGVLDSLALNISADKRFSQGDTFGAIKEYQTALLADENNGMAWNSLGICLAGLGRHAEAERHFSKALACNPDDGMALYNLGYIRQSQGQDAEAQKHYMECLARTPEHLFALVRLGQLAENRGETAGARALYEQAAGLPGGESLTRRHFARLCLSEDKPDEAREHLHEALLHDPQDALAMQLLARLYLDAGEDPDMAASLARQSVSLRPGLKAGWLELARALESMGKEQQAKEARLRAGEV